MATRPSKKSLTLNRKYKAKITNGETNLRGGPIFIEDNNDSELHFLQRRKRGKNLFVGFGGRAEQVNQSRK